MITVENLTKTYGTTHAVDGISFTAEPGIVTGFLGPNGAGKTTTMRIILGLDKPTSGTVTVNGKKYASTETPLKEIGALLDAKAVDRGRSARNHLRAVGATVGIGRKRVDDVLEMVGLADVAKKSAGSFSLGMGQRLGIATALLADPHTIMLDEPVNGLDPDGILWIRDLLKTLAGEGRTVFVSSHLMSEMEQTADHLIIIGRGRILADETMESFIASASGQTVRVASPEADRIARMMFDYRTRTSAALEIIYPADTPSTLDIVGVPAAQVGELCRQNNLVIHELRNIAASLEDAFMDITQKSLQFRAETTRKNNEDGKE